MITHTFANRLDKRITIVVHGFDECTAQKIVSRFSNNNARVIEDGRFQIPTFMADKLSGIVAEVAA